MSNIPTSEIIKHLRSATSLRLRLRDKNTGMTTYVSMTNTDVDTRCPGIEYEQEDEHAHIDEQNPDLLITASIPHIDHSAHILSRCKRNKAGMLNRNEYQIESILANGEKKLLTFIGRVPKIRMKLSPNTNNSLYDQISLRVEDIIDISSVDQQT